jgi:hypothetical protein
MSHMYYFYENLTIACVLGEGWLYLRTAEKGYLLGYSFARNCIFTQQGGIIAIGSPISVQLQH